MNPSETKNPNTLMVENHFPSSVYFIERPEFLETARFVSKEYLNQAKKKTIQTVTSWLINYFR